MNSLNIDFVQRLARAEIHSSLRISHHTESAIVSK